ncbi:hypothetical protein B4113_2764 [Geobacillus sp. B4113_201601]|nr:hypothetical protein B4113_2764 [Geobacillus sp. B4113_201601]
MDDDGKRKADATTFPNGATRRGSGRLLFIAFFAPSSAKRKSVFGLIGSMFSKEHREKGGKDG